MIARAAVFPYKGKNPIPAEVGRDLKVRYIVDGSVRRTSERIRVSVSLTDTNRSAVLWSEKYGAEPKDIFSVQDQITRRISGALALPGDRYANVMLAVAYAAVGRQQEAERLAKSVRQRFPTFPRDQFGSALRDPSLRAKLDHALKKAGL